MVPTLKSEFRKLLTVRSTYGWLLLALVIVGIYSIYGMGFNDASNLLNSKASGPAASLFLAGTITQMASFISVFGGIIALLLITHEYRHNTITYTLTASNSRTKVLASKIITVFCFTFVYSVVFTILGLGMIFLGLALSHNVLPHQDINYATYIAKSLFYAEGFALVALLFGFLIRNQVGAFAALFIIPNTAESLLSLLLKSNSVYMPFMAVQQVIQAPVIDSAHPAHQNTTGYLSAPKGALVFLVYLFAAWLVAWYLFLRRDAA
ncbi:MAG TPA: ABC transporter permease subunit [Candidatus Saccharimonadales bacterium]|nr:ABC transporter permease subunit [Candidatus Saccharimonadales bacterium]